MDKPLVSIIIPVFGAEQYLNRTVQSVADLTYKNLEIILGEDGSPDNCPAICDAWAAKDRRVKAIHQKNSGISHARNTGIEAASGDYIGFLDDDDVMSPIMIEALVSAAIINHADITIARFQEIERQDSWTPFDEAYDLSKDNIIELSGKEATELYFSDEDWKKDLLCTAVWNKLYTARIFIEHPSYRFPEGKGSEDRYLTHKLLISASKVLIIKDPVMLYYIYSSSSTYHRFSTYQFYVFESLTECADFCASNIPTLTLRLQTKAVWNGFYILWWADHAAHRKYEPERKKLAKDIKSYIKKNHLWRHLSKVQKGKYLLLHFGLTVYDFVWNKYHQK